MDGLEATRRLRAMGFQRPIVALTGNALAEDQEAFLKAGVPLTYNYTTRLVFAHSIFNFPLLWCRLTQCLPSQLVVNSWQKP